MKKVTLTQAQADKLAAIYNVLSGVDPAEYDQNDSGFCARGWGFRAGVIDGYDGDLHGLDDHAYMYLFGTDSSVIFCAEIFGLPISRKNSTPRMAQHRIKRILDLAGYDLVDDK